MNQMLASESPDNTVNEHEWLEAWTQRGGNLVKLWNEDNFNYCGAQMLKESKQDN